MAVAELMLKHTLLQFEYDALKAINAELLKALELIGGKDLGNGVVQVTDDPRTLREIARQAIAKTKQPTTGR